MALNAVLKVEPLLGLHSGHSNMTAPIWWSSETCPWFYTRKGGLCTTEDTAQQESLLQATPSYKHPHGPSQGETHLYLPWCHNCGDWLSAISQNAAHESEQTGLKNKNKTKRKKITWKKQNLGSESACLIYKSLRRSWSPLSSSLCLG